VKFDERPHLAGQRDYIYLSPVAFPLFSPKLDAFRQRLAEEKTYSWRPILPGANFYSARNSR
jgi:hypothetical protein